MIEIAVFLLGGLTALLVFACVIRPVMLRLERILRAAGESTGDVECGSPNETEGSGQGSRSETHVPTNRF